MGGTSREYLLRRLEQAGEFDLVQAVHNRVVSAHAAAIHAGILRPRPTLGMQENVGKAIAWQLARISRGRPPLPAEVSQEPPLSEALARHLAEAYVRGDADVQQLPKRRSRRRRSPPASPADRCDDRGDRHDCQAEPEGPDRAEAGAKVAPPAERVIAVPIDPELPCLNCSHWCATAACKEIATIYLQARRGDLHLAARPGDGVLPASCCRRRMGMPTVAALIA
jgi:hypothetical protein